MHNRELELKAALQLAQERSLEVEVVQGLVEEREIELGVAQAQAEARHGELSVELTSSQAEVRTMVKTIEAMETKRASDEATRKETVRSTCTSQQRFNLSLVNGGAGGNRAD